MNDVNDLREARGELRQFMRELQEDPTKNVIPYGNDATLTDNVWITHAEVVLEFVRLNPRRRPLAETLVKDSTRKYRLNQRKWLDVKETPAPSADASGAALAESFQLVLDSEPMASAFRKAIGVWCGKGVKVETETDAHGHYCVRVWPKSAAEGEKLGWLCEGFKKGYHAGSKERPG